MLSKEKTIDEMTDEEYYAKFPCPILIEGELEMIPIDYEKKDWKEIVIAKTQGRLSHLMLDTSDGEKFVAVKDILLEN